MSLNDETLNKMLKIMEVQRQTLDVVNKVLDAITLFKDELNDTIADNHQEVLKKIHEVDSFSRNILEKNQKTIWNKLLELEGEEVEQTKKEE